MEHTALLKSDLVDSLRIFSCYARSGKKVVETKCVSADFDSHLVYFYVLSKKCSFLSENGTFTTMSEFNVLLKKFHEASMCPGITKDKFSKNPEQKITSGFLEGNIWRSNE